MAEKIGFRHRGRQGVSAYADDGLCSRMGRPRVREMEPMTMTRPWCGDIHHIHRLGAVLAVQ